MQQQQSWYPILFAAAVALPGIAVRLLGIQLDPPAMAFISGAAIIGASFLLLWACDAAQADISQTLALAVVALIAVLPEYAVDMYFTWQAGRQGGDYSHYAIANMTGANRLLIGVAWAAIAAICWFRHRKQVQLEPERRTELLFLGMATVYAFLIPMKGTLAWYDALVFMGIYGWYMAVARRRPCGQCEVEGPAELLTRMATRPRRLATVGLFLYAAGAILANAEPFCEGLIGTGTVLGISKFLLVQWLAPIASEAPEFTVALVFAWRGQAGLALGSLLSAKLNQWTLLVGMIPAVYALAHGSFDHPMPMDTFQMHEILLTAAQSLLGVALLISMRLSLGGAVLLFGLFAGQLVAPVLVRTFPALAPFGLSVDQIHPVFAGMYMVAALAILLQAPKHIGQLWQGRRITVTEPCQGWSDDDEITSADYELRTPQCARCKWRRKALTAIRQEQNQLQEQEYEHIAG